MSLIIITCMALGAALAQPKAKRVVVYIMDGLHHQTLQKIQLPVLQSLIPLGSYTSQSVMIAPHHPTVGEYGHMHTSSFPNPVLQAGNLFAQPTNTYVQEWVAASGRKTAFLVNTNAYQSVSRGFHYQVQDGLMADSDLVQQAITWAQLPDMAYMRVHLQTPGNQGRYLSYTTPDKPYYRNLWGAGSPYVAALQRADRLLGQLVAALKQKGLWQETVLIITSDQGQSHIGWHPPHDPDSWFTPLLVLGPGIAQGRKLSYVEHTDLSPTIAHLLGVRPTGNNAAGGAGKVVTSMLADAEETTAADAQYLLTINKQCQEYARLRAQIQLQADQNAYASSFLAFLENELLTPEPFYHLDRFTEWYKAGTVPHLVENNERILVQMRQYLNPAYNTDAWRFSPAQIRVWAQRVCQFHADSLAPKLTVMRNHWDKKLQENKYTYKWPSNGTWNPATYYAALADWWRKYPDARAKTELLAWGERNQWVPTNWDVDMANNHLAGHAWLTLYDQKPDTTYLNGIRRELDRFMTIPFTGKDAWWWCDALYMAPIAFHHMTQSTGDVRYRQFAHEKWWVTTALLQDPETKLFYRDTHYVYDPVKVKVRPKSVSNTGGKVLWSRGNGWVVAGLVRILPYLSDKEPATKAMRAQYVRQLQQMMQAVVQRQRADGGWTVSMEDSTFKTSETSATALFAYAMAAGIKQGVLPAKTYEKPMQRAWIFLSGQITTTGKVTGAQRVGHDPTATQMEKPDHFSQGVWLQAAQAVHELYPEGLKN